MKWDSFDLTRILWAFARWDEVKPRKDCYHCHGTGLAPSSDGKTECGFCQ